MPEPMGPTILSSLLPAKRIASGLNYGRKIITQAGQSAAQNSVKVRRGIRAAKGAAKGAVERIDRVNQRAAAALSGLDTSKPAAALRGVVALGKEVIKGKERRESRKRNQKNKK